MQHSRQKPSSLTTDSASVVDVSVIIVNYNVREFLKQALSSVYRAMGNLSIEIIVVDNNSVDGSQDLVSSEFPDVSLIRNTRNVGFGAANNVAIRESKGRYLLILNPDTIVQEDTLVTLVEFMDRHPMAGAAGCRILNPDGTFARESRRAFPTPQVAFYRMSGLSRLFPRSRRFGRYNLTYLPTDQVAEVDALSGSCMMIRRAAISSAVNPPSDLDAHDAHGQDVSQLPVDRLFDEAFFMYGEDLDLCYRIQEAGWKIYYTPDTQIIHYKGESTRKGNLRYVKLFYGAMLLFSEKHFRQRSLLFRFALQGAIVTRAAGSAARRTLRSVTLPLLDFAIVYLVVTAVAALRFDDTPGRVSAIFLLTTPVLYAAASVIGIRMAGGYKRGRKRVRPVLAGLLVALVTVASVSFFIKAIAFSRFVILASVAPAFALLLAWRVWANRRRKQPNRALVVGDALEAARLKNMVASHIRPPFSVVGYTSVDITGDDADLPVKNLGTVDQLRDIIRLWNIDEVIFATRGLKNRTVVSLMQTLRDLPVEFKTFVERGTHVIGKARVEDLAVPLISTEDTFGAATSGVLYVISERLLAFAAMLALAAVEWVPFRSGAIHSDVVTRKRRLLGQVVAGRCSLVGWTKDDPIRPPEEWDVPPGVFSVSDAIPAAAPEIDDIRRAWQTYLNSRSMSLDLEIVASGVRRTIRAARE